MRPIHLTAGLLCIAAICVDSVVWTRFQVEYTTPLMLWLGLMFGQLALLATWCARGRLWLPIRLATLAAAAWVASRLLSHVTAGSWTHWFTLQCLYATSLAGIVFCGDLLGWQRAAAAGAGGGTAGRSDNSHRWRYSVAGLMSLLTVTGMALGVGRTLSLPVAHMIAFLAGGAGLVLVGAVACWAAIPGRTPVARGWIMLITCLAVGYLLAHIDRHHTMTFFSGVAVVLAMNVYLSLKLLPFDVDTGNRQQDCHEDHAADDRIPGPHATADGL